MPRRRFIEGAFAGDSATMAHPEGEMKTMAVPAWMRQSMHEQGAKLHRLLADCAVLAA